MVETAAPAADDDLIQTRYGNRVRLSALPARVQLEHQTVQSLMQRARMVRATLELFRAGAFSDIDNFIALLAESYGANRGGTRGGTTLESIDGMTRIEVSVADTLTFGPELQAARALIDQCIEKWSVGANANLKALVDDAFKVGAGGRVDTARVLGLRRLPIEDDDWTRAMTAIADAVRPSGSRQYLRFYQRTDVNAKWEQISLDLSRL